MPHRCEIKHKMVPVMSTPVIGGITMLKGKASFCQLRFDAEGRLMTAATERFLCLDFCTLKRKGS